MTWRAGWPYTGGAICEIIRADGEMARLNDLMVFAEKYDLKVVTIADLINYRRHREL